MLPIQAELRYGYIQNQTPGDAEIVSPKEHSTPTQSPKSLQTRAKIIHTSSIKSVQASELPQFSAQKMEKKEEQREDDDYIQIQEAAEAKSEKSLPLSAPLPVSSPAGESKSNSAPIESPEEFMKLIEDLNVKLAVEKRNKEKLEAAILYMCNEYDRENDELAMNPDPDIEKVQDQFNTWAGKIEIYREEAIELIKATSAIVPLMSPLEGNTLSSETIHKLRFLHRKASIEIEKNHEELLSKKAKLERDLKDAQVMAREILNKLRFIKQHPHCRRSQILARIAQGEKPGGTLSEFSDRFTRHAYAAGSEVYNYCASFIGSTKI